MESIRDFFARFEALSAAGDASGLAGLHAATFLACNPGGSQIVPATTLQQIVPTRKQWLASLGCRSTRLMSVTETPWDERFISVRTEWQWEFQPDAKPAVAVMLASTLLCWNAPGPGCRSSPMSPAHGDLATALASVESPHRDSR